MKKALANNLGLKLLALAVSILLWMIVVNTENPVSSTTFTNIPVTVTNAKIITNRGNTYSIVDSNTISVTVTAKQSVLRQISASDIKAVADMKNLDTLTRALIPIEVSVPGFTGVTAVAKPVNLMVQIEMESVKSFPITPVSDGTLRDGYEVGELVSNPKQIEIRGPESVVDSISKVVASVNVSGLSKDEELPAELYLYDVSGKEIDVTLVETNLGDAGLSVKVKVYQKKSVPVEFDTSGISAASGYVLEGISVEPTEVEVIGPLDDLKTLEKIEIPEEVLATSGLTKTVEQAIDISEYLPEWSKQNAENTEVIVLVKIYVTREGTKTIEFPTGMISLLNVPKGYKVDFGNTNKVDITVKGTSDVLEKFELEQGAVSINLSGIKEAGTYELPLQIVLDSGITLDQQVIISFNLVESTEE